MGCETGLNIHVVTLPAFVDKFQKFLQLMCVYDYVTCLNRDGNMLLVKYIFLAAKT